MRLPASVVSTLQGHGKQRAGTAAHKDSTKSWFILKDIQKYVPVLAAGAFVSFAGFLWPARFSFSGTRVQQTMTQTARSLFKPLSVLSGVTKDFELGADLFRSILGYMVCTEG